MSFYYAKMSIFKQICYRKKCICFKIPDYRVLSNYTCKHRSIFCGTFGRHRLTTNMIFFEDKNKVSSSTQCQCFLGNNRLVGLISFMVPYFDYGRRSHDRRQRKGMKVILNRLVAVFGNTHDPIGI